MKYPLGTRFKSKETEIVWELQESGKLTVIEKGNSLNQGFKLGDEMLVTFFFTGGNDPYDPTEWIIHSKNILFNKLYEKLQN